MHHLRQSTGRLLALVGWALIELARAAKVADAVTRAVSGHSMEAMQRQYSTVNGEQMRRGLARVVSLAGFMQAIAKSGQKKVSSGR
jgi:hypothetical protein